MGRSGSSYVASALHQAGVYVGDELKSADQHNRAGYFEDLEVLQMHERWLVERGLWFDSVSDRLPLAPTAEMDDAVAAFVRRRQAQGRRWGVKAPGLLFFWPVWRRHLPEETTILLPFRHPNAVVQSLVAWGNPPELASMLWLQLNRLALDAIDTSPFTALVLDWDDPWGTRRALTELLGEFTDPYDPTLHHHEARDAPMQPAVRDLYAELQSRAGAARRTTIEVRSHAGGNAGDGRRTVANKGTLTAVHDDQEAIRSVSRAHDEFREPSKRARPAARERLAAAGARALLWPLRRFFDPRFQGLSEQTIVQHEDVAQRLEHVLRRVEEGHWRLDELQSAIHGVHGEATAIREALEDLRRLVVADMEAANEATTLLGESLAELLAFADDEARTGRAPGTDDRP